MRLGYQAKTDSLDAAMLAEIGERLAPEPTPLPDQDHQRLKDLSVTRISMMRRSTAAKTQFSSATDPGIQALLKEEIEGFHQRIERLDEAISEAVAASQQLARRSRILCSITGTGAVAAADILAWLLGISTLNAGQVGALSGMAPLDRSSGQYLGRAT